MSNNPKEFIKPLIPFEEYYAVLKTCVEDSEVISAVCHFFELHKNYYNEGGDPLSDCREESAECYNAFNNIGLTRDKFSPESWNNSIEMGQSNEMDAYIIQLIWQDWPKALPYRIDIKNKSAVKAALKAVGRAQIDYGDEE